MSFWRNLNNFSIGMSVCFLDEAVVPSPAVSSIMNVFDALCFLMEIEELGL